MTELEERLRRDLKSYSERIDPQSVRPLRDPPARRRSPAVRWLAPVTAVTAVIGIITGVSLAGRSAAQPPASLLAPGQMPAYYVTLAMGDSPRGPSYPYVTTAFVRDSATGAVLAALPVPTLTTSNSTQSPSITAAGDDRTFVITELGQEPVGNAAKAGAPHSAADWTRLARFYLLRVAANGRSASLSRLPISVPGDVGVNDVALSPDGGMLAIAGQSCSAASHCRYTGIRVINLATGATREWTAHVPGSPWALSWAGDEHLAFQWQSPASQGYRLLSVTGAGGNLLAAPAITGPAPTPTHFVSRELITPDGRVVITSTVQNIPEGHGRDTVVAKIVALDASTGQLLRVLHTVTEREVSTQENVTGVSVSDLDQGCRILALGPTGVHALVECFGFGRLDGTRFTPLPGVPDPRATTVSGSDFWGTATW
jgi:hypothetical protein